MTDLIHYRLTGQEMRAKCRSTGSFDGPNPLCGNGSFHVTTTRTVREVTCPACLVWLGKKCTGLEMTRHRYWELQEIGGALTQAEVDEGWFFDDEYDGLLANRAWEGHGGSSD